MATYTIPTEGPESDGTLAWEATTIVVVHAEAAGRVGVGYTYAGDAAGRVVADTLADVVVGGDAHDVGRSWTAMVSAIRNLGRPGIAGMAVSAVDIALWDLKARILDLPLVVLLDARRSDAPIYGSGGFCSYTLDQLQAQLGGWVAAGIPRVKMKVGRHPDQDDGRVAAARDAIGPDAELFVDGNGAYRRALALAWAHRFADHDVTWFEEPVTSDDLEGLRLLRDTVPAGMDVTAGEYGFDLAYFRKMLDAGSVDCLQVDVTRCGGFTGFLETSVLTAARSIDVSAHCAPQVSAHAGCAAPRFRHLEYFHDHARIERLLFDGVLEPEPGGLLRPDRTTAGMGLTFKQVDAERLAA